MNLKTIGYYKEMPHGRETDPSMKDNINLESEELIPSICSYLNNGLAVIVSPGATIDVLDPEKGISGSATAYTDGEWLWPGDLAYYVGNYRLKLPDVFINTMKNNNWNNPIDSSKISFDSLTINGLSLV